MTKAEYASYLRSDHWHNVKKRYRKSRLPWKCGCCQGIKKLDLHHKTYKRLGSERLTDLLPLCRDCHSAVHELVRGGVQLWPATRRYRKKLGKKMTKRPGHKGHKYLEHRRQLGRPRR